MVYIQSQYWEGFLACASMSWASVLRQICAALAADRFGSWAAEGVPNWSYISRIRSWVEMLSWIDHTYPTLGTRRMALGEKPNQKAAYGGDKR